jgi:hypothetical protein
MATRRSSLIYLFLGRDADTLPIQPWRLCFFSGKLGGSVAEAEVM